LSFKNKSVRNEKLKSSETASILMKSRMGALLSEVQDENVDLETPAPVSEDKIQKSPF
jgi:hypothetical protein